MNYNIKITADGAGGFFKICATLVPDDYYGSPEKYKISPVSVNKIIILALIPCIKETYDDVKIILEKIKLNNIEFKIVCDLKLLSIYLGLQGASATYPCPYCYITLDDLRNRSLHAVADSRLRTFSSIKTDAKAFQIQNDKKSAKKFIVLQAHPLYSLMMM